MGLDGRRVRLVDLDLPSCEDHQLDDDEWARIPRAAVLDPQSAVDRFTVLAIGDRGVALEPRRPGSGARRGVHAPRQPAAAGGSGRPQGATNRLEFGAWTPIEHPRGRLAAGGSRGVQCSGGAAGAGQAVDDSRGRRRR
jgi:hypothetical protein